MGVTCSRSLDPAFPQGWTRPVLSSHGWAHKLPAGKGMLQPGHPIPLRPIPGRQRCRIEQAGFRTPSGTLQPLPSLSPKARRCPGGVQPGTHRSTPTAPCCTHVRATARLSRGSQADRSYAGSGHKHEIFGGENCSANGRRRDPACYTRRRQREKEDLLLPSLIKSG